METLQFDSCPGALGYFKKELLIENRKQQGQRTTPWVLQHLEVQQTARDTRQQNGQKTSRPCNLTQDRMKGSENGLFAITTLERVQWWLLTRLSPWSNFHFPALSPNPLSNTLPLITRAICFSADITMVIKADIPLHILSLLSEMLSP